MRYLATIPDVLDLASLAERIRRSSNFRFNWQFYRQHGFDPRSPAGIRLALEEIVASPDLHQFLRESFHAQYDNSFAIGPVHEHSVIVPCDDFEDTLARAANDRLGAYSSELHAASSSEKQEIFSLFEGAGKDYLAYELLPGEGADCDRTSHLFSSWFLGVAWDWCLFVTWPAEKLLWMGCLTDTD